MNTHFGKTLCPLFLASALTVVIAAAHTPSSISENRTAAADTDRTNHTATQTREPKIFFDRAATRAGLMRYFRTTDENLRFSFGPRNPSTRGLKDLHASASEQPTETELRGLNSLIDAPRILLIDLRAEPHAFVHGWMHLRTDDYDDEIGVLGEPISWQALDETTAHDTYPALFGGQTITVFKHRAPADHAASTPTENDLSPQADSISIDAINTEAELADNNHFDYIRLPIADKTVPDEQQVARFFDIIKQLPANTHIHFHEADGRERTTLFMILYDIFVNGDIVSIDDIIKRQFALGGVDFNKPVYARYKLFLEKSYHTRQATHA